MENIENWAGSWALSNRHSTDRFVFDPTRFFSMNSRHAVMAALSGGGNQPVTTESEQIQSAAEKLSESEALLTACIGLSPSGAKMLSEQSLVLD